jgi:hypothetical protein
MKLINNYNCQTLLVGKVIYKRPDDELKYYTVIKANDAPLALNDTNVKSIFAIRGGNVTGLYVVKAFDQKQFSLPFFQYDENVIKIKLFAKAPQSNLNAINFYILQFIGYNGFCTEVVKASSLKQAKKTMFSICHTAVLANVIVAKITHTENL